MTYPKNLVNNYARSIKLTMLGKSAEAQNGALTVVNGLLHYATSLNEEDQTYDAMLQILKRLSVDMSSGKSQQHDSNFDPLWRS